jgi:uncharacterized protein YdcH (DUF465 family)
METEIIEALREKNEEYRKLYEEHKKLEEALGEIDKSKYITAEEGLREYKKSIKS